MDENFTSILDNHKYTELEALIIKNLTHEEVIALYIDGIAKHFTYQQYDSDIKLNDSFLSLFIDVFISLSNNQQVVVNILSILVSLSVNNADGFIHSEGVKKLFLFLPKLKNQHYQMCILAFIHDCLSNQSAEFKKISEKYIHDIAKCIYPVISKYLTTVIPSLIESTQVSNVNKAGYSSCLGISGESTNYYYCGRIFKSKLTNSYSTSNLQCGGLDNGLMQCNDCKNCTYSSKINWNKKLSKVNNSGRSASSGSIKIRRRETANSSLVAVRSLTQQINFFYCNDDLCNESLSQCTICAELQHKEVRKSITMHYTVHILQVLQQLLANNTVLNFLDEYDSIHDSLIALTSCTHEVLKTEAVLCVGEVIGTIKHEISTYICDYFLAINIGLISENSLVQESVAKSCVVLIRDNINILTDAQLIELVDKLTSTIVLARVFDTNIRTSKLHLDHTLSLVDAEIITESGISCIVCKIDDNIKRNSINSNRNSTTKQNIKVKEVISPQDDIFDDFKYSNYSINSLNINYSMQYSKTCWKCDFCNIIICQQCCGNENHTDISTESYMSNIEEIVVALSSVIINPHIVKINLIQPEVLEKIVKCILSMLPIKNAVEDNILVFQSIAKLIDSDRITNIDSLINIKSLLNASLNDRVPLMLKSKELIMQYIDIVDSIVLKYATKNKNGSVTLPPPISYLSNNIEMMDVDTDESNTVTAESPLHKSSIHKKSSANENASKVVNPQVTTSVCCICLLS